jgi:predicted phosphodiesterase
MYDFKKLKDRARLVEIAHGYLNKFAQIKWKEAYPSLNKEFNEHAAADSWRKRYDRLDVKAPSFSALKDQPKTVDPSKKREGLIKMISLNAKLSAIMQKLGLTKYEVLGLIKEVESEGIYKIKDAWDNGEPIFTIEKSLIPERQVYSHAIGETSKFTFMVISDSHLGSKNEQLTFLHYLYDEAKLRGITNIYHCGDLSEGFKKSRDDHMYSLHSIGFDDQADYIIRNYPEREGITTFFITGNHDHFHIQNGGANIGKRVAASRRDMQYLGINTAVIQLTPNCKMELFHPQDGSSYALSYSGQKYLDSLSGGDKPNIIFVGHHHKYISMWYRNVWYFEVPSTHLQSDWEKGKRIRNDSGALVITVEVDSEGTLVDCNHSMIPHIKHIKDDWKSYATKSE